MFSFHVVIFREHDNKKYLFGPTDGILEPLCVSLVFNFLQVRFPGPYILFQVLQSSSHVLPELNDPRELTIHVPGTRGLPETFNIAQTS